MVCACAPAEKLVTINKSRIAIRDVRALLVRIVGPLEVVGELTSVMRELSRRIAVPRLEPAAVEEHTLDKCWP